IIFIPWTFTALYAREAAHVDNVWIGVLMCILYLGSVLLGLSLGSLRRSLGSVGIVLCFWAASVVSAVLLLPSSALPILVLSFFHASYLKPPRIDVVQDDVTPLAA